MRSRRNSRLKKGVDFEKIGGILGFGCSYKVRRYTALQTSFRPVKNLVGRNGLCGLITKGVAWAKPGYTWDGASGPTWDTASVIRASLFHDILYQLLREKDLKAWDRKPADELLYRVMRIDGAFKWRARVWLWGVRRFAASAAKAQNGST